MNKILTVCLLLICHTYFSQTTCVSCNKVIFIVDNSGSVDDGEYAQMQTSISAMVDELASSSPGTQMAVIQYAGVDYQTDPGKYEISVPFTTDPTVAKTWVRAFGAFNLIYNDFLPASFETLRLDGVWEPGGQLDLKTSGCVPVFIVFTDATADDAEIGGSSLMNGGSYSGMLGYDEYNFVKTEYGAYFIVYHVTDGILQNEMAGAAISSVGGSYNGPIDNNPGDPEGNGVLPRNYFIGSFVVDPTTINAISGLVGSIASKFEYLDNCTGDIDFLGLSGSTEPIISWSWDFGDGGTSLLESPSHFYPPGTYDVSLAVVGASGCKDTVERTINISLLAVDAGPDLSICNGENVQIGLPAISGVEYLWAPATTLSADDIARPIATPATTTVYSLILTGSNGCITDPDFMTVTVNNLPTFTFSNDVDLCIGQSTVIGPPNDPTFTYVWSPATGLDQPNISSPTASPTVSTNYTLVVTNSFGCSETEQVNITVNPLPVADAGPDEVLCEDDLLVLNYDGGLAFTWFPNAPNASGFVPPLGQTDFTLTVTDANGCQDSDIMSVLVNPNPIADFTVIDEVSTFDPSIQLTNNSTGAVSYSWDFDDGTSSNASNPSHLYAEDQYGYKGIVLTATSVEGCIDTARRILLIREELIFYIPNSFTPNGDELNNTFKPIFTSGFDPETYHLYIFNRWGELIFESLDYTIGWSGDYFSRIAQDDTYVWKVEFTRRDHSEEFIKTGHVTLFR